MMEQLNIKRINFPISGSKLAAKYISNSYSYYNDKSDSKSVQDTGSFGKFWEIIQKIANSDIFQLISKYLKVARSESLPDLPMKTHSKVIVGIIGFLLRQEVDLSSVIVVETRDQSILIKGKTRYKSVYFEVTIDEELDDGYELICNVYEEKVPQISISGDVDFVVASLTNAIKSEQNFVF
ncbi:hypothetical protein LZD49_15125 [Dyadobacter sp. CY261]|uniref:hypothetical protein n=1 Tax=Dyadobacter sp. CY261 TaxID=2907203 RepID=UPI001F1A7D0D|nr:hypothetical protein [Dyadobacter sp. CY261]MCF0071809.1 hypothetical protein [Dyadobacter sp. CY261]